jgi:hypothetical protein
VRAFVALVALAACGGAAKKPLDPYSAPSVQIQILLDDRAARARGIDALADQLTVTPERLAVISDHKKLYRVGWGGAAALDGVDAVPDAFDYTADGVLLAVRASELAYLDGDGTFKTLFALPHDGMALASGSASMFVFDRKRADGHAAIYELDRGRQARKLLESPQPIDAVTQGGNRVFFASGGLAFEATPGSRLRAVAALPGGARIRSLAASSDGAKLYASDGDAIYEIEGQKAATITRGMGGTLRVQGGGLLVLDAKRRLLARIEGLR